MSSSRSDVVTHSISLSVRKQGVFSKPKEFQESLKDVSSFKEVSWAFQQNFNEVLRVFQESNYKLVLKVFERVCQEVLMVFQVFKGVSRKFQVSRVVKESFKGISRKLQEILKGVSREFKVGFKGI